MEGDIVFKETKILLIIPAYNEAENILNTIKSILDFNKDNKSNLDYIVINDGSTDNTANILDKNKINHIDLIHNLGIGGAVQTGYKYAAMYNYDIAIQFDGDGQHDISFIPDLVKEIEQEKNDFVIGSRFVNKVDGSFKSTAARRIGIKVISFFIKLATGIKIYDTTSGFRACNKNLIQYFKDYYPLEYPEPITTVEVILNNYKIKEIPVKMKERQNGVSSIKAWKNFYYMINVILSIIMVKIRRR